MNDKALKAFKEACLSLKPPSPDLRASSHSRDGVYRAISLPELHEVAATKWIRPRLRDGRNPHLEAARFNPPLKFQDGRWYFVWGMFLLDVNRTEYGDTENGRRWTSITLYGH